jgi:hypothetical protein
VDSTAKYNVRFVSLSWPTPCSANISTGKIRPNMPDFSATENTEDVIETTAHPELMTTVTTDANQNVSAGKMKNKKKSKDPQVPTIKIMYVRHSRTGVSMCLPVLSTAVSWEKYPFLTYRMIDYIMKNPTSRVPLRFSSSEARYAKVDGSRATDHHRRIAKAIFHENEDYDVYKDIPVENLALNVKNRIAALVQFYRPIK